MDKTLKQFISEAKKLKTVVFTFGRFNPPTLGHGRLIDDLIAYGNKKGSDIKIYASHTQDPKKNPLSWKQKIKWMKMGFPQAAKYIQTDDDVRNPFQALAKLDEMGYDEIILSAGGERVNDYKQVIARSKFKTKITIADTSKRTPGVSATDMRAAAAKGDLKTFSKLCPNGLSPQFQKKLMNEVREGLKLSVIKEAMEYVFENVLEPRDHLGIKRESLPQIPTEMVKGFLDYMKDSKDVDFNLETEYPLNLKPTQDELSLDKAADMVKFGCAYLPLIISSDNYILDGHHRWLAQTQLLPISNVRTIPVYRLNLDIKNLIKLSNKYIENNENT